MVLDGNKDTLRDAKGNVIDPRALQEVQYAALPPGLLVSTSAVAIERLGLSNSFTAPCGGTIPTCAVADGKTTCGCGHVHPPQFYSVNLPAVFEELENLRRKVEVLKSNNLRQEKIIEELQSQQETKQTLTKSEPSQETNADMDRANDAAVRYCAQLPPTDDIDFAGRRMCNYKSGFLDGMLAERRQQDMYGGGYITPDVGGNVPDAYELLYKRFIRLKSHHTAWCAADACKEDPDAWESR